MKSNVFKKCVAIVVFALIVTATGTANLFAQKKNVTVIKLASLAPEATPWGEALNKAAKDWSSASGGNVELRVYHNGVAGTETDVLRKLKLNQVQAAVFTSIGLAEISPESMTLSVPFLVRTDEELNAVFSEIKGDLEANIAKKGFQVIAWNKAGWVRFFARNPVRTPSDLKKQKFGAPEGQASLTNTFKGMGYNLIPIAMNDILMSLNSGSIDAVFGSPIAAAPMQTFGIAKNMSEFKISPFLGCIVINQAGWNSIPSEYRNKISALSAKIGPEIDPKIQALEAQAIKTMQNFGLIIVPSSAQDMALWYADMDKAMPDLLKNKTYDINLYNKIQTILKRLRK
ncbi:hypothetical protein FACS1894102_2890 [Spirochaetia bacterium]|nr:hypothetical protein FACS1894102_2890 [Spirochaetia bacterium]